MLDEITAEAGKYMATPRILTSTVSVRLLSPLFVGDWCEVEARVTKHTGARIVTEGQMSRGATRIATGEFVLADMTALEAMRQ